MHAATVVQLLVIGVGTGSIYALIALGFNVVFKSTGAMNFAQGEWVVMAGMIAAVPSPRSTVSRWPVSSLCC